VLGGLFVGVTLLLPRGIIGAYEHWRDRRRDAKVGAAPKAASDPTPRATPEATPYAVE
jgi:urea transport system permease protein